jgi:poly-beta-1,6-N-acetyl-D-glucosamine synthase
MAWVIPLFLAYIPGVVIGFMVFTLLVSPYRELPLTPPSGSWPSGQWPPVTILIAAFNEETAIVPTLERVSLLTYEGPVEVILADNNSTDRTAELADAAARRFGLRYRRVFEAEPGKHRALNTALRAVTTPFVATVDADTFLQREALTRLIVRVASTPQDQHVAACAGALVAENPYSSFIARMQRSHGGSASS